MSELTLVRVAGENILESSGLPPKKTQRHVFTYAWAMSMPGKGMQKPNPR